MFQSVLKEEEAFQLPWEKSEFGGQQVLDTAYRSDRMVQPQGGESLAGRIPQILPTTAVDEEGKDDPYGDMDFFRDFSPLYDQKEGEGFSPKVNHVAEFYMPKAPDAISTSEKNAEKALLWEKEVAESPARFLLGTNHYGRLSHDGNDESMTNHAIYMRNFHQWKSQNDEATKESESRFNDWKENHPEEYSAVMNRAQSDFILAQEGKEEGEKSSFKPHEYERALIDHGLKMRHMEEAKRKWASDENDEHGIPHKLGLFDYLFGLEWLTPKQRHEVYEHIFEHGLDDKDYQNIGDSISAGRLKRNLNHRFSPIFDHWVRAPHHPDQNIRYIPPHTAKNPRPHAYDNYEAFKEKGDTFERAENYMLNRLSDQIELQDDIEDISQGYPRYYKSRNGFAYKGKGRPALNRNTFLMLMNVNPSTGKLYHTGDHPLYRDWKKEESPLSQEEVNDIIESSRFRGKQKHAGQLARKWAAIHHVQQIDPDYYNAQYANEEDTLRSHWGKLMMGGGMGKHENSLFDMLHHHSLKVDKSGEFIHGPGRESMSPLFSKPMSAVPEEYEAIVEGKPKTLLGGRLMPTSKIAIRSGMVGAMAAFAQPHVELKTRMVKYPTKPQDVIPRTYTDTGDITDAAFNLNPHGRFLSGRTQRYDVGRMASSLDPSFHDEAHQHHRKSMRTKNAEDATEYANMLGGNRAGIMGWNQPLQTRGGTHNYESRVKAMAQVYHNMGTAVGMAHPIFQPSRTVHDIHNPTPDITPTTSDVDDIHDLGYISEGKGEYTPEIGAIEESMNRLIEEMSYVLQEGDEAEGEEAKHLDAMAADLMDEYQELKQAANELDKRDRRHIGPARSHHAAELEKVSADLNAINSASPIIRSMIEQVIPDAFSPNLPIETIEGNMLLAGRLTNDFLHHASHETHGLKTKGLRSDHSENVEVTSGSMPSEVKAYVHSQPTINSSSKPQEVAEQLGLDYTSLHVRETVNRLLDKVKGIGDGINFPAATVGQVIQNNPNLMGTFAGDLNELLYNAHHPHFNNYEDAQKLISGARKMNTQLAPYDLKLGGKGRMAKPAVQSLMDKLGLTWHHAHYGDPNYEPSLIPPKIGRKTHGIASQRRGQAYRAQQHLDSVLMSDPTIRPKEVKEVNKVWAGLGPVNVDKVHNRKGMVGSLYNSAGFRQEFGTAATPNYDYRVHPDGSVEIYPLSKPKKRRLVPVTEGFWKKAAPHLTHLLTPDMAATRNIEENMAAQFRQDSLGRRQEPTRIATSYDSLSLASLTNIDIIRKELGAKAPLLQPMHRIFELGDLEHLKGFTGDWVVSALPEGERGFVKKNGEEVESSTLSLSKDDEENFAKISDEDYHLDVIKIDDAYQIFDVIEFEDKEVHDLPVMDRMKILRGAMESHENVHLPSASDTRLTDDDGLELTVGDLQKEHGRLLLRDAKSTYMVGEMRHPKWVLLSPGKDVVLMVLERRGSGPYTYRLGTGPIVQDEHLGSRGIEVDGDTYMEMGAAFDSPDKYDVGDHVRVNVISVGEMETDGHKLYTITGSEIEGEAEGEGLVSQETLSILAKSEPKQWLCEVDRALSGIRITMPQGDVVYKATHSGGFWSVHSPLANNHYLIRLSESQRPYWSPVAGAILKGGVEITEKEEVHESEDDAEPLIEPTKVKGTDFWNRKKKVRKVLVKGLVLVEKMLNKSGVGAVGQSSSGPKGLGIDYATPIESPTGPTNLHDSKTMPDYSGQKKIGEDDYIEPGKKDSGPAKHVLIPVKGGELEIAEDFAVLHT